MKTIIAILNFSILFLFSTGIAKAANAVYLPFVANPAAVQIVASTEKADFTVDSIRLWDLGENGGSSAPVVQCGHKHKVQIHVFNVNGDQGEQSRLNDIAVNVVRLDAQGARTEEIIYTGQPDLTKGVVEIELTNNAEIRISHDGDGHTVTSEVARVTNLTYAIPTDRLIESGYCTDTASCQAFTNANTCNGNFSWNVVFKRSY